MKIRTCILCSALLAILVVSPESRLTGAPRPPLVIPEVARDQVICFCLYTLHETTLKMSVQLYPLQEGEARRVELQVRDEEAWETVARAPVSEVGWMASLRVRGWQEDRPWNYRVVHPGGAVYEGIIRANPIDKDEIVVASLSCNSNSDRGPRQDIVDNLKIQDPDLLFFAGDQSYDHKRHYAAWLLFGRQFGDIIRDRPTVTIPDDHDVGHGNLWGAAGRKSTSPAGDDGGYFMPPEYVNMVQRAQTSHLPDPFDATPVHQGITVYYTRLNIGGIDFAIIEDRKWKTGPRGLVPQQGPRPDHITSPNYDPAALDVPEAQLLGPRQLDFLRQWAGDWDDAIMKVVLSQTIFGGGAHLHGNFRNRLLADLDSNGWPQSGRARALREIRKAFAFMMGGDQHLATVIHHGINDWEDAGVSFCNPSIWNYYARWWWPLEEPLNHDPDHALPWTGRFHDGFRNKLTVHAYANPAPDNHKAAGYGLVRFHKPTRRITMECWPRFVDVRQPDARQFTGWPVTIHQMDNYARRATAWLPEIVVAGSQDPVIQVIDNYNDEVVYTLRIQGTTFRPKVFRPGTYTLRIRQGDREKVLPNVATESRANATRLEVRL